MSSYTGTTLAAVLKTLFPSGRVKEQLYPRFPFMAMVKKDPTFSGDGIKIPVIYGASNGASAAFSTAQANKDASKIVAFTLTTIEEYSLASVTRKVMLQTRNDKGARLKALEHAHKMALYSCGRAISASLYRSGTGAIGQISSTSTVASVNITLTNREDAVNFQVGMKLQASAADGGALRSAGATVTLTGVNRGTGVLTCGANWSAGIGAIAASDYLYREGDAKNGGTAVKTTGLLGWLPTTDPSASESFFGVDRSVDRTRLAGYYYDGSALPAEEALIEAQSRVNVESLGVDTFFCNPKFGKIIKKALGTKVQYGKRTAQDEKGAMASISFETVRIDGDKGPIDMVMDADCPVDTGFPLRMDSWTLYSMLDAPHIFDEGTAQQDLRESSADAYEGRTGAYLQLGPTQDDSGPGDNGVVSLPTA